jgi:hypothetical protein
MPLADIVERLIVAMQLDAGMTPTEVLVAHYDDMARRSRTAGRSRVAAECLEARDIVAFVKPQFFIDLARTIKTSLSDIIQLFKDRGIVRLFDKVGWSFSGLWEALKGGYKAWKMVQEAVAEYVAKTKGMQRTKKWLEGLDAYLREHPRTRRLAGYALGLLMLYLWFVMADTGDAEFDWDISEIVAGLSGSFSLSKMFAGPEGTRLLMAIAVGGLAGLSFPWPAANAVGFVVGAVKILAHKVNVRLRALRMKEMKELEQEAQSVGIA